jgi:hypothetical protein
MNALRLQITICEAIITNIARVLTDRYDSLKGEIYIL